MEAMEALRYQPSAVARVYELGKPVRLEYWFLSFLSLSSVRSPMPLRGPFLVTATVLFCAALRKMLRKNPRTLICC